MKWSIKREALQSFGWLLLCLLLSSCSEEQVEVEEVEGYRGRAKYNPYLVAERYLDADGKNAQSGRGVLRLTREESTVFLPASAVYSEGEVDRILDWVIDGGHFVLIAERGEEFWSDVGEWTAHTPNLWSNDSEEVAEQESPLQRLYAALEVKLNRLSHIETEETEEVARAELMKVKKGEVLPNASRVLISISEDLEFQAALGGLSRFEPVDQLYYEDDWYDTGVEKHKFLSRSYGEGRVTFLSEGRLFRNPYLAMEEHAELLDHLAIGDAKVVFSMGKDRGFLSMLIEHGAMALLGMVAVISLWLWRSLPRFGPLLLPQEYGASNYAKRVHSNGKFLWEAGAANSMIEGLRNAIWKAAGVPVDARNEAGITQLSMAIDLSENELREALVTAEVSDPHSMVQMTKQLQKILKQL